MFGNLKAEMSRYSVRAKDFAKALEVREATISAKMTGKSEFTFDEAMKIKRLFFPKLDMEYLFSRAEA